ncbi:NAD(P)/FAD-dependent oxidoreductase [Aurantiacibacter spongiae]|uniref:FAD-binding domain-containing protein n=1 Tax=Aurantiacibacter spongiae TaxID=2488860 RepID=A0A3N5DNL0_9SPHN|nr:FAD-dependent monooxygenase [Aurantiacibacter spongiae]RPF70651.1 hypothetical protein EG799_02690 [Aurantiacibacter spongiae]
MRIEDPLILGAGPAGCAAAIALAREGARPLLVDRDENVGDPLCGGFLSWRTVAQLRALGVDPPALGAHRVETLRLFAGGREACAALPEAAFGLSRQALDTAMRTAARHAGATIAFDAVTRLERGMAIGRRSQWRSDSIFLATGKHDVRGQTRPREGDDIALGLRLRLPASAARARLIGGAIELHLFDGGYAGIVLQEGGSANVCLALRKSALARYGGSPDALFESLAAEHPALAERFGDDWTTGRTDTIGAVPYGWIARETAPGLFRLGDQAAVIPSLAGEGISIAVASGVVAARHWSNAGEAAARAYQHDFAARARRPVQVARLARRLAESPAGGRAAIAVTRLAPTLVTMMARMARIDAPAHLAPPARAA